MVVTSGGLTIDLLFDAAAMAAPASFRAAIVQAATMMSATITDKITVSLEIDYRGSGSVSTGGSNFAVAQTVSYSTVRADLINHATAGDTAFNALPGGSSIQGQSDVEVFAPQLKLWGLLGANDTTSIDGSAIFSTEIDPSILGAVALHELTHALGRFQSGPMPDIFDLFRFTSAGTRLFDGDPSGVPPAYFSIDGGTTKLADYGQTSDASDFLNSGVQGGADSFNEFAGEGAIQYLTAIDLQQLDALGFHVKQLASTTIEGFGETKLDRIGGYYFLDGLFGAGGPALKSNGVPVIAGQMASSSGTYIPIGAEPIFFGGELTGYRVVLNIPLTDQYQLWITDSSCNVTSTAAVSSTDLQSLEPAFNQDLNNDHFIGVPPPTKTIEASGFIQLDTTNGFYYLDPIGARFGGPILKSGGSFIIESETPGTWKAIGVEKLSNGGYEVAWNLLGTDSFKVWITDASGAYVSGDQTTMSGASAALKSLEISFQQDLNGDGVIGVLTVIEAAGVTKLDLINNIYFLDPVNGVESGVPLQIFGGLVTPGSGFGAAIGAEKIPGGYEVVFKTSGADQYSLWLTDDRGNYLQDTTEGPGNSTAVMSLENTFDQDLNGDGVVGFSLIVIESFGSTKLDLLGGVYSFDSVNGLLGPALFFNGSTDMSGRLSQGWQPVGAEKLVDGTYQLVWHQTGSDNYDVWNTDSKGFYVSDFALSGTSPALQALETSFHQDLNGDGTIHLPASVIETTGMTRLDRVGNNFSLDPVTGGSGPLLTIFGLKMTPGLLGLNPIAAEKTASGFVVALKSTSGSQYSVWTTDNSGSMVTKTDMAGTDSRFETFENTFHQDLNGDGVIGVPTAGSTPVAHAVQAPSVPDPGIVRSGELFAFRTDVGANSAADSGTAGIAEAIKQDNSIAQSTQPMTSGHADLGPSLVDAPDHFVLPGIIAALHLHDLGL